MPLLVIVVTRMQASGIRARSSRIIGWSESRSPALAPCSQMRGPPRRPASNARP
jgi:hypothetical protein